MFFKDQSYKEYVLPNTDNSEYSIILDSQLFGLKSDTDIKFECRHGKWIITPSENYSVSVSGLLYEETELKDNMLLDLMLSSGEILAGVVSDVKVRFTVFEKFNIPEPITITVGSDSSNIIRYTMTNLVSSVHCSITIANLKPKL